MYDWRRERHRMQPAELDDLEVGIGRLGQLHRGVGLQPQHVGGLHRAVEVDEQLRMGALKFDQPRREPECSEALGDGELALRQRTRERLDRAPGSDRMMQLHLRGRSKNLLAFRRRAHAVDMAGQQGHAELMLEIVDAPTQRIDRKPSVRGRAKASAPHNLKKYSTLPNPE